METWNATRRMAMLVNYNVINKQENYFQLLFGYLLFIGIYFVGMTKEDFAYKISWAYLS